MDQILKLIFHQKYLLLHQILKNENLQNKEQQKNLKVMKMVIEKQNWEQKKDRLNLQYLEH